MIDIKVVFFWLLVAWCWPPWPWPPLPNPPEPDPPDPWWNLLTIKAMSVLGSIGGGLLFNQVWSVETHEVRSRVSVRTIGNQF